MSEKKTPPKKTPAKKTPAKKAAAKKTPAKKAPAKKAAPRRDPSGVNTGALNKTPLKAQAVKPVAKPASAPVVPSRLEIIRRWFRGLR